MPTLRNKLMGGGVADHLTPPSTRRGAQLERRKIYLKLANFGVLTAGYTININMFKLLTHDPIGHRVNIIASDIAADAIRFNKRCAASHKWIGYTDSVQIMWPEERVTKRSIHKL